MNFQTLVEQLLPTTRESCRGFAPELVLCVTIVLMLLARMPRGAHKLNSIWIALPGALVALSFAAPWLNLNPAAGDVGRPIFDGLLIYDSLTVYFRSVLLLFLVLFLIFTRLSGIPDREDSPDFYTLVLGAIVGMCVMASANHLLTVFLGVEMASVPSYALAGILKGRRKSSEAALKYSVYGAGTAGVMLYGISLLAGALGTCHIPSIAQQLATLPAEVLAERQTVLMMGGLMVAVGLSFKLAAFPFHFWCPDVFEGASAEVNAFLSVASKAAALALLIRVATGTTYVPPHVDSTSLTNDSAAAEAPRMHVVAYRDSSPTPDHQSLNSAHDEEEPLAERAGIRPARRYVVGLLSLLAAVTCTFGNLAAYGQTNIKRLLAYSTIAHAGYMMMPVAAAVQLAGTDPVEAERAIGALNFYVAVYLFMNLGAFAVVAFLRNSLRSEEIADYAGLIRRSPTIVVCFTLILISLIGLPPLAGFAAKYSAFLALATARRYDLLIIGALNTALSLFYYLRVVKVMTIDPESPERLPGGFSSMSLSGLYVVLITIPVVVLGVWFNDLNLWARAAAHGLFS